MKAARNVRIARTPGKESARVMAGPLKIKLPAQLPNSHLMYKTVKQRTTKNNFPDIKVYGCIKMQC